MDVLETERLVLRPFERDDLDDFYTYAKNPNVGPNAGWKPHENKRESRRILREFIEGEENWAITLKDEGKVIGSIGLHPDHKRDFEQARMLGYGLNEPYWGQGLMTEAARRVVRYVFQKTPIVILSIYHYPYNQRSRRVIEKCGFHHEGTLRMAVRLFDGRVCDHVCYSMTREEFYSI